MDARGLRDAHLDVKPPAKLAYARGQRRGSSLLQRLRRPATAAVRPLHRESSSSMRRLLRCSFSTSSSWAEQR